jgi:hypothetical protein
MCWNASISINTFLFSTFAVILAFGNNILSLVQVFFYMSFISMQFIEYLIWSKTFSNRSLSMIALLLIVLQPVCSLICIKDKNLLVPLLIGYSIFVAYIFTRWNTIDFRSIKSSNGHLSWKWLDWSVTILAIWMFFFFISFIINKSYLYLIIGLIAVVVCYVLFRDTQTWGSLWCWISNACAIVLLYFVFAKDICIKH